MKQALEAVYMKKDFALEDYDGIAPFVLNRVLSMNHRLITECERINQYSFFCDYDIVKAMMHYSIKKQNHVSWRKYIKPLKEKEHEFEFLLCKFKDYYHWSEKDAKLNLSILLKQFENKDKLRYFFRFFGIDKKYYKKYEIEIKKEKKWF